MSDTSNYTTLSPHRYKRPFDAIRDAQLLRFKTYSTGRTYSADNDAWATKGTNTYILKFTEDNKYCYWELYHVA